MMKQHHKLTLFLCLTWTITLLYGEMFAFWIPTLRSCSWPSSSSMDGVDGYDKVAVIADPQIMDKTSLHLPPKSLALEVAQFFTDLYMRRAFFASILPFKPDVILFLGDHFDGGPYLSDEEWKESLNRFKHIFGLKSQERFRDIRVHFLPGNHDNGYAALLSHKPEIVRRYEKEFGKRNYRFTVGKVEFIVVDAQTLDGYPEGNLAAATWDFVKNVSIDFQLLPRVLLTHIPLYRRDETPCGPHRSSPIINQRIVRTGHSQEILYQNYITEESSNRLFDLIKPLFKVGTKEKTEDENCEYEMVWDAEGSMHLVRKATNTPITRAKDTSGTMERGNAVMRHTAKKGNAQEVEISMNVDDPMTNLPPRTSKSTAKFIIHRLVRMFRMLTVIAVVNIPLYMMLLFKDWIDQ